MSFIFLETNHKFIALTVSTHKKRHETEKISHTFECKSSISSEKSELLFDALNRAIIQVFLVLCQK
jgi:hypothetical protein